MENAYWRLESSKNNSPSMFVYYHRSAARQIVSHSCTEFCKLEWAGLECFAECISYVGIINFELQVKKVT